MADGTGDGDAQQPRGWFGFGGVRARAAAARRGPGGGRRRLRRGRGKEEGSLAGKQPAGSRCAAHAARAMRGRRRARGMICMLARRGPRSTP